jgi:hypothetical protein
VNGCEILKGGPEENTSTRATYCCCNDENLCNDGGFKLTVASLVAPPSFDVWYSTATLHFDLNLCFRDGMGSAHNFSNRSQFRFGSV